MKPQMSTKELEDRIGDIYERIMKVEESARYNLNALKTLKDNLQDCQKELAKMSSVKKPTIEKSTVEKSPVEEPAVKKVAKPRSPYQTKFNAMSFEERQKFLKSLGK